LFTHELCSREDTHVLPNIGGEHCHQMMDPVVQRNCE
jgi:hypothetical protein